ncbi:MAG: hypothetical protein ACTH7W_08155 [Psychrobacter sp.]|uniref:hypothetical protein n=1 Tax=unclassified Psychrobacter TaxID=196806 RepID=UPI001787B04F|nr:MULTISPECIES: hypothetical protein [unclassified Psychrobacter]MBE0443199.1 hypothetical protein [Psychrobacter sp. FME13]
MKKSASLLFVLILSQSSLAEWQLVNENDPTDPVEIYVDFHQADLLNDLQYQVPMKTSTWPRSHFSDYPITLYEPYITASYIIDCTEQIITTHSQRLFAKTEPSGSFADIFDMFELGVDGRSTRPLEFTDAVDKRLYERLCQSD